MYIEIKNLGPISNFKFDISKDLNVIFGKNNIGKSYAITAIYLIIKNLTSEEFRRDNWDYDFYLYTRFRDVPYNPAAFKDLEGLDDKVKSIFKDKDIEEINIKADVEKILLNLINRSFTQNLEKSFKNSFSSIDGLSNKLSNQPFSIVLSYADFKFSITIKNQKLITTNLEIQKEIIIRKSSKARKVIISDDQYLLFYNNKTANSINVPLFEFIHKNFYFIFKNEVPSIVKNVYFLPASRSGLYQALSTFSAVIAELSKSRNFLTNRIELPNISEPVSDYFLSLSKIQDKKINQKFSEIVEYIERDVLEGRILFNKETKKIVFAPEKIKAELDLSFTSSMISEIAPIVAFLKYIIEEKEEQQLTLGFTRQSPNQLKNSSNLIFIEEPEAHLHPVVQVKLIELFARLVNLKVKIVMTSHSNYMFNKLSNLILEEKINYTKVGSYLMSMTENGSVIDSLSMRADADGMEDNNFADVAEELYEERISIYDKLNNDINRKIKNR